jgi:hypothetical protein
LRRNPLMNVVRIGRRVPVAIRFALHLSVRVIGVAFHFAGVVDDSYWSSRSTLMVNPFGQQAGCHVPHLFGSAYSHPSHTYDVPPTLLQSPRPTFQPQMVVEVRQMLSEKLFILHREQTLLLKKTERPNESKKGEFCASTQTRQQSS